MARILRGEIRWADLNPVRGPEQSGQGPVIILSHDIFNARSGTAKRTVVQRRPAAANILKEK